ncbi:MAG: hypothetical protein AAGJ40_02110 [Planctomycetota bacterium]
MMKWRQARWAGTSSVSPRLVWFVIALAVGLIVLFSLRRLSVSAVAAESAVDDARLVAQMAQDIRVASQRPAIASLQIEPPDRISLRVEAAMQAAKLPPRHLISIEPQTPTRIRRTPYRIRPTMIVLVDVTIADVVRFSQSLDDNQQGMTVRDLSVSSSSARFSSSPESRQLAANASGERWEARMTLTQMIYSPISDR